MIRLAVRLALLALPLATSAAEVTGRALWAGPPPAPAPLETTRDRSTCGPEVPDETLLVAGGGVQGVVIRIEVPGARAAPRTATLDQKGCRYVPHVQVVPTGSTLEILNGDPLLHNVHGYAGAATAFNVPMPLQGGKAPRTLARPGVIRVGCDVHGWMSAAIVVTDTPHVAVTGPGGGFTIEGVPPGTWQVVAWHERLGERRAVLTVPASGPARLDFQFP